MAQSPARKAARASPPIAFRGATDVDQIRLPAERAGAGDLPCAATRARVRPAADHRRHRRAGRCRTGEEGRDHQPRQGHRHRLAHQENRGRGHRAAADLHHRRPEAAGLRQPVRHALQPQHEHRRVRRRGIHQQLQRQRAGAEPARFRPRLHAGTAERPSRADDAQARRQHLRQRHQPGDDPHRRGAAGGDPQQRRVRHLRLRRGRPAWST